MGHIDELNEAPTIVAIGTSTGGPKALEQIFSGLPDDLPVGIIVVQHMPRGFTSTLAKRLNSISKIAVREANHGEVIQPATAYIAPSGRHLTIQRRSALVTAICLSDGPPNTLHKPSVDVMMLSVAEAFGRSAVGIILTGMGEDGLEGMMAIHRAGGTTIGQDEATSVVYGMPRVCAENGALQRVVALPYISGEILRTIRYSERMLIKSSPAIEPQVKSTAELSDPGETKLFCKR